MSVKAFRVVPYASGASTGQSGHPLTVEPSWQGAGRADNPALYRALYCAESSSGAIAEAFGDLAVWTNAMFEVPYLTEGRRQLARLDIDVPDALTIDLDDAAVLLERGLRPTEVAGRNRQRTREVAAELFIDGYRQIRWWSWWRPEWRNRVLLWPLADPQPFVDWVTVTSVEELDVSHPAVVAASEMLRRTIET